MGQEQLTPSSKCTNETRQQRCHCVKPTRHPVCALRRQGRGLRGYPRRCRADTTELPRNDRVSALGQRSAEATTRCSLCADNGSYTVAVWARQQQQSRAERGSCVQKIPVHGTKSTTPRRRIERQDARYTKDTGYGPLLEVEKGWKHFVWSPVSRMLIPLCKG
jgi:hypothetical protein